MPQFLLTTPVDDTPDIPLRYFSYFSIITNKCTKLLLVCTVHFEDVNRLSQQPQWVVSVCLRHTHRWLQLVWKMTCLKDDFHKLWELNLKDCWRNQAASLMAEMQTMESHFWWIQNLFTFSILFSTWNFSSCKGVLAIHLLILNFLFYNIKFKTEFWAFFEKFYNTIEAD